MLPDLPTLKAQLQFVMTKHVSFLAQNELGMFKQVPKHFVHEGAAMKTIRADGSSDQTVFSTASAEIAIDTRTTATLTHEVRLAHLQSMASELASQMRLHLYGALNEMLQDKGQVIDGKNFGPETIFKFFEKIQMDFDINESPTLQFDFDPHAREKFRTAMEEIEGDPILAERFQKLMADKKEQWRDREAARKLVG